MSGHSKWSTIKHKKGAADARRGKIFTKIIKEITTAARTGGGDVEANPRLRVAVLKAKAENMTKENIERAIKRGTAAQEGGVAVRRVHLRGVRPRGRCLLVEMLTDNKNRTTAEIRHIFSRYNGNLGEAGSVAWIFSKKGYLSFEKQAVDEDKVMEVALEAGAEDVREDEDVLEVLTDASNFEAVKKVFDQNNMKYQRGPDRYGAPDIREARRKSAETMLKLMEILEDSDDVQDVHANFDISTEEMERLSRIGTLPRWPGEVPFTYALGDSRRRRLLLLVEKTRAFTVLCTVWYMEVLVRLIGRLSALRCPHEKTRFNRYGSTTSRSTSVSSWSVAARASMPAGPPL